MGSGLRLGSPAVSVAVDGTTSSSWIGQFMQQVRGLLDAHIASSPCLVGTDPSACCI